MRAVDILAPIALVLLVAGWTIHITHAHDRSIAAAHGRR